MQKLIFFVPLLIGLLYQPLQSMAAIGIPRPIGGESRIKIINYTPNTVFKFIGHYEYQSIIEFGADEQIDTITMGTPTPWQIVPAGNRIFIKPVEENATTNMTVITNKRMYFFEMHAQEAYSINDEKLSFVVKFVYPEQYNVAANGIMANSGNMMSPKTKNGGPDLSNPQGYNFKYSISGDAKTIEPLQIFDDGEFTYFKFKDLNAELPAIFMVDKQGKEGLINFRVAGDYIVVERVSDRFTLRHGSYVICVYNENGDYKSKKKKFLIF